MRGKGIWLGWGVAAGLVAGAAFGWLRRSRRSPRGAAVAPRPTPPPRPRVTPSPGLRPSSPRGRGIAAGVLVAVVVLGGLTYLRAPGPGREVTPTARAAVPTALSSARSTRVARPTPVAVSTRAPEVATTTAATAVALGPTPTALVIAAPTTTSDPLAAVRALGPLRGMGYNPTYATADVPRAERAARLRRDMRLMHEVGVDMVLGWEPGVFDEELLAAADENGVHVILPFDLKPGWDYADPDLRARVMREVSDWVVRYRDQPAVLMWGLGNEVTIEMDDAGKRTFAAFYVQLFELVRALDPSRPVVLREAEDVFAPYLAEAFAERQGFSIEPTPTDTPDADADPDATPTPEDAPEPPRPVVRAPEGFVYGVNFYTERVGPALQNFAQDTQLDAPLLVSEYAPAGVGRAVRADGFAKLHELIAANRPRVLGSSPYTWTTAGPEAVDDYFGLVDKDGQPVDDALAEIARLYGVAPPAWTVGVEPRQQLAAAADLPQLLDAAATKAGAVVDPAQVDVRGGAAQYAAEAADDLGIDPDDQAEGAQRARAVADLVGWARELSSIEDGDHQLFPGMREALPLLNGMARWSRDEPSALETAQGFMAAVLRRDLAVMGG